MSQEAKRSARGTPSKRAGYEKQCSGIEGLPGGRLQNLEWQPHSLYSLRILWDILLPGTSDIIGEVKAGLLTNKLASMTSVVFMVKPVVHPTHLYSALIFTVQYGSHHPCVAIELLKYG